MKFGPDIELIYWDIGCQYEKKIGPLREFYVLNDVIILKSNDVKMTHNDLNGYETVPMICHKFFG